MKYRKKPVVVNAAQWMQRSRGEKVAGVFLGEKDHRVPGGWCGVMAPHVHTIHDNQAIEIDPGDWIIAEPDGTHFYPCKPDIFAATYEAAE